MANTEELRYNGMKVICNGVGADGIVALLFEDAEMLAMQLSEFKESDSNNALKSKVLNDWQCLFDMILNPDNLPYDRNGNESLAQK